MEQLAPEAVGVAARFGAAGEVALRGHGLVVETATTKQLFAGPRHPYTEGLMASIPRLDRPAERLYSIPGNVPAATHWPTGCRFHPRCPHAWDKCRSEEPPLLDTGTPGHTARCWLITEPQRRRPLP